jgi:putative PIN family toxin of toxin-antitoxin system
VVDTNIFVGAGFNSRSSSAQIIQLIRDGALALVWNEATLRETAKIVRQIPRLSWDKLAPLFRDEHKSTANADEERFHHIEDRDDRKFAALAHASQAVLISNDAHLLSERDKLEVRMMQPSEFLRALAES